MTRQKDLKRLVRARMAKTGESYTAARAQLIAKVSARAAALTTPRASTLMEAPPAPDYAALSGTSETAIKKNTGCSWERWVYALDRRGAAAMTHTEIARIVREKYKVGDWWTQAVTVGYERIKGLRARGQRRNGTYEVNKSRTFNVPVATLFDAWSDPSVRRQWLDGRIGRVRTQVAPRSLRFDGGDNTIVVVGFTRKGPSKSSVAIQHTKVGNAAAAAELKQYWGERMDALGGVLNRQ